MEEDIETAKYILSESGKKEQFFSNKALQVIAYAMEKDAEKEGQRLFDNDFIFAPFGPYNPVIYKHWEKVMILPWWEESTSGKKELVDKLLPRYVPLKAPLYELAERIRKEQRHVATSPDKL